MCMIFNHKGKPAYIRLCCRTGMKGQHYPIRSYCFRCISPERIAEAIARMEASDGQG